MARVSRPGAVHRRAPPAQTDSELYRTPHGWEATCFARHEVLLSSRPAASLTPQIHRCRSSSVFRNSFPPLVLRVFWLQASVFSSILFLRYFSCSTGKPRSRSAATSPREAMTGRHKPTIDHNVGRIYTKEIANVIDCTAHLRPRRRTFRQK